MSDKKPRAYFVNFKGFPAFWYIDSEEEGLDVEEDCIRIRSQKLVKAFILRTPNLRKILGLLI